MKLSVVVALGYTEQRSEGNPALGDEFDHVAPALGAEGVELILVDRAWPSRWDRVEATCGHHMDRVKYIPPRPTELQRRGYFCVASTFNSGAIVARGHLLMFVGDFLRLNAAVLHAVNVEFDATQQLLHPYIPNWMKLDVRQRRFTGHNPGVKVCTARQFEIIGGYNEHLDGTSDNDDIEFQIRLDALMLKENMPPRIQRLGYELLRTNHANGVFPVPFDPLWPQAIRMRLRCNQSYVHALSIPRGQRYEYKAPTRLTPEMLDALRRHDCDCPRCQADDREQQLESYAMQGDNPDIEELRRQAFYDGNRDGMFNPWGGSP
jgi:hypothetical protein